MKGRSRKEAQKKHVDGSDREVLETLLEKGRNRRDFGGAVIEQLGFMISLWKPLSETEEIGLSIICGSYSQSHDRYVATPNSVIVSLPTGLGKFKQADYTARVLSAVVKAWEPSRAGVMSRQAINERASNGGFPLVDWMLYLPNNVDGLEPPSYSIRISNGGCIVVIQPEPPSGEDPEESARAVRIARMYARPTLT